MQTLTARVESSKRIHLVSAPLIAAALAALLTVAFWMMCHRSIVTNAPTWVDGPVLDILESFRSGRVYQPAGLRMTPYTVLTHTPLSYVVDYAFYKFWPGFAALRLVNILATLACAGLIFTWVKIRTGTVSAAIFAASAFVLLPPVFKWSQTTRSPDAFCCLFSLAALIALDCYCGRYRDLLVALFVTAAVLSKQTALFVLCPTLLAATYWKERSLRTALRWSSLAAILLAIFLAAMLGATHGGFWTNVVDGNKGCSFSWDQFILVTLRHLCFFWLVVLAAWRFSREARYTTAHFWAIFAIAFGLASCAKLGSDTMYFFDASAAVAMLAGLGLHNASPKRCAVLLCSLIPCLVVFDLRIAKTAGPRVTDGYHAMLTDLEPYPTVLSDEASIAIQMRRPWYWGDPLVLNALAKQGKWDSTGIEEGIAQQRYAAIVIWNPTVWPLRALDLVQQNYIQWRSYPAFKGKYVVYIPKRG